MSAILDTITGGGLLPHVYCKKVVLENHPENPEDMLVTLHIELYQKAAALQSSNWLNNFNILGANIYDSMFIEVIPFRSANNIKKLLASNEPTAGAEAGDAIIRTSPGNVYVVHQDLGDGYLPRSSVDSWQIEGYAGFYGGSSDAVPGYYGRGIESSIFPEASDFDNDLYTPPLRIQGSSIVEGLSGQFLEAAETTGGKVREEIINGEAYYIIPFQQSFKHNVNDNPDLGFLFYSMLHVPHFFLETGLYEDISTVFGQSETLERYVIEGPVNTEIVLKDGKPAQTREAFTIPGGETWEGSVHLHSTHNPASDGYSGDGGFGENRGWMVGERHMPEVDQPKLALREVPNDKIQDFRSSNTEYYDGFLGLGVDNPVFALDQNVQGSINMFLSPFQKETRKYLSKFGAGSGGKEAHYNSTGVSYYDNDSEFSKLYLTRDMHGSSRGVFYIDKREFLFNNSKIFPILFDQDPIIKLSQAWLGASAPEDDPGLDATEALAIAWSEGPVAGNAAAMAMDGGEQLILPQGAKLIYEERQKIINNSKILEIKLYRDRVKKQAINSKREKWANDTSYEEPSYLVSKWDPSVDVPGDSIKQGLVKIEGLMGSTNETPFYEFCDKNIADLATGQYQYRLEVVFEDASYSYLSDLLREIVQVKGLLTEYYQFAAGNYNKGNINLVKVTKVGDVGAERLKKDWRPYYDNKSNAFAGQFMIDLESNSRLKIMTEDTTPIITMLKKVKYIFGLSSIADVGTITNLISPVNGNPQGINFVISFTETVIKKLEDLLDVTKLNKTGSELASKTLANGYNYNNFYDVTVSPTDNLIHEEHTFYNLFEGSSNKDIYVEYLKIKEDWSSGTISSPALGDPNRPTGLRKVSVDEYITRCVLETAKFYGGTVATSQLGGGAGGLWAKFATPSANFATAFAALGLPSDPAPSLATMGCSFLAPSIIEISDSLSGVEKNPDFVYHVFTKLASSLIKNGNDNLVTTSEFGDIGSSEQLLIAAINHAINKETNPHADLLDSITLGPHNWQTSQKAAARNKLKVREAYKNIFKNFGMQIHSPSNFAKFYNYDFSKRPGVIGPDEPDAEEYHTESSDPGLHIKSDYSDGTVDTSVWFRELLSNPNIKDFIKYSEKKTIVPDSDYTATLLPNIIVFLTAGWSGVAGAYLKDTFKDNLGIGLEYESGLSMTGNELTAENAGFRFVNIDLLAGIEVYDPYSAVTASLPGFGSATKSRIAKDDGTSWRPITKEDITNIQQQSGGDWGTSGLGTTTALKLLCRIKLFEEARTSGLHLPMLDKYFIITN